MLLVDQTLFSISRMNRSPIAGGAGRGDCDLPKIEAALVDEVQLRRRLETEKRVSSDGMSAMNWLKNACYQIILAWAAADSWHELEERTSNRFKRGTQKADRNIFERGIVGIFANSTTVQVAGKSTSFLTSRKRERLASPMWYAFRHYIPPALLDGFNVQYPGHLGREPRWQSSLEPALYPWIQQQRFWADVGESSLEQFRGRYPRAIQGKVDAAVTAYWATTRQHSQRLRSDENSEW